MFGLLVFLIALQEEVNVSNHLSREDCEVAAAAIQKSQEVKSAQCVYFKPKSVEEGF